SRISPGGGRRRLLERLEIGQHLGNQNGRHFLNGKGKIGRREARGKPARRLPANVLHQGVDFPGRYRAYQTRERQTRQTVVVIADGFVETKCAQQQQSLLRERMLAL